MNKSNKINNIDNWNKEPILYYILYLLSRDIGFYVLFEDEIIKQYFDVNDIGEIKMEDYINNIEIIRNIIANSIKNINNENNIIIDNDFEKKTLNLIKVSDITVSNYITFNDFIEKYINTKLENINDIKTFLIEFEKDLKIIIEKLIKQNISIFKKIFYKLFGYKILNVNKINNGDLLKLIVFFLKLLMKLCLKKISTLEKEKKNLTTN